MRPARGASAGSGPGVGGRRCASHAGCGRAPHRRCARWPREPGVVAGSPGADRSGWRIRAVARAGHREVVRTARWRSRPASSTKLRLAVVGGGQDQPGRGRRTPAARRPPSTAHGIGAPTSAAAAPATVPDQRSPAAGRSRPARCRRAQQVGGAAQQPAADRRRCRCCRRPAARACQRPPGSGANRSRRSTGTPGPAPGQRRPRTSTPERGDPAARPGRRPAVPARSPGPAPGLCSGPAASRRRPRVRASGRRQGRSRRRRCAASGSAGRSARRRTRCWSPAGAVPRPRRCRPAQQRPARSGGGGGRRQATRPPRAANRVPRRLPGHRDRVARRCRHRSVPRAGRRAARRPAARPACARRCRRARSARRPPAAARRGSRSPSSPPAAVGGRPEHRVRRRVQRSRSSAPAEQRGVDLRGVHAQLQGRQPGQQRRGVGVRGRDPLAEPVAALRQHRDAAQRRAQLPAPGPRPRSVPSARPRAGRRARARHASRVSSSAAAARSAASPRGRRRAEPGLDPARHRRLGQHDHARSGSGGTVTAAARPCPGRPAGCPAPTRTPSTARRPAAGTDTATRATRQPAAPARSSSSSG